jgi:hypothetical protein
VVISRSTLSVVCFKTDNSTRGTRRGQQVEHARAREGRRRGERLAHLLNQRARVHGTREVRDALDELAEHLRSEAVDEHHDLIVGDVSAERAQAILEGLEEVGLASAKV